MTTKTHSLQRRILQSLTVTLFLLLCLRLSGQELQVRPANEQGIYQPGEAIRWNIRLKDSETAQASYVLKKGGLTEISQGTANLIHGEGQIEAKLEEPGWLLVEVSVRSGTNKTVKALGGALVSPDKIQPSAPRPEDFDNFWAEKLKELAGVPMNSQLTPTEPGKAGVDYFKISMGNIRGSHIRGQLARPQKGEKLPAMLIVQWAGVYGLQKSWVTDRAAEGWLVLNINAHDLPIDEPEQFYSDQSKGPLKDYPSIGNDDRETSYFLRMYLSCYRGAHYLAERAEWDGRTLVVTGGSQGGLQSLVTASLHPKISAVLACVPAGCDLNGPEAGRLPGWPMWHWNTKGKEESKVRNTARYFDVVNFASRITCPVLVGVGLIDSVCPSPGVFSACNQIKSAKEIVVLPEGEHGDKNGSHQAYYTRFNAWKDALAKGAPAPVR
jgi:cephalosporin-C deacetylase